MRAGEDVDLTITAHYFTISPALLFTAAGSNAFRIKVLLPEGFVQTGGNYVDYIGTELSAVAPTATYHLIGYFTRSNTKQDFRLIRGRFDADANSLFVEKARLSVNVGNASVRSLSNQGARNPGDNYAILTANCSNSTLAIEGYLNSTNRLNIVVFKDNALVTSMSDLVGPSLNLTVPYNGAGSYYVRIQEVNNDGNNVSSAPVSVNCSGGNPNPPTNPNPPSNPGSNNISVSPNCGASTLTISGYLTSSNRINIQILKNNAIIGTISDLVGPSFNQSVSLSGDGSYSARAQEVNNDGNNITAQAVAVNCSSNPNPPTDPNPPTNPGTGNGLTGFYTNSLNLSEATVVIRSDASINFSWPGSPADGINADLFSVYWLGQVEAPVSGNYTFKTNNDDATRLAVNRQLLIDDWNAHSPTLQQGSIYLTAGQKYYIEIAFADVSGPAQAQLFWEYPGQSQQLVPTNRLYQTAKFTPTVTSAPAQTNGDHKTCSVGFAYYQISCVAITACGETVVSIDDACGNTGHGSPGGGSPGEGSPPGPSSPPGSGTPPGGAIPPPLSPGPPTGGPNPGPPGGTLSGVETLYNMAARLKYAARLEAFYTQMAERGITFDADEKDVLKAYPDAFYNLSDYIATYGQKPDGSNSYIMSAEDQRLYPRFTQIVKSLPAFVEQHPKVKQALMTHTNLPYNRIKGLLPIGAGAKISIYDIKKRYGDKVYGHTIYPAFPQGVTEIDITYVQDLERASTSGTREVAAFLLTVTLLHELTHYGAVDGHRLEVPRSDEFGDAFERQILGTEITKDNAGQLMVKFYNNN